MSTSEFKREEKTSIPVVAICYDFDKTLSPDDMQAQGYIQSVGFDVGDFWKKSNGLARGNDMDNNLAYMYVMMTESEGKFVFNRQKLQEYGAQVQLFPGVETWFERIRKYGKTKGVEVEHYIISSGLKEMIEGTSVAKNGAFKKIYASSFYYNERGVAVWPAQVINYTNKTQFLFRIEKGVLDINDSGVNDYFTPDNMRIPFRNMIYIGDSDTDIPCMKLVNSYGGHSIGVYNADTQDKKKVYKMMHDKRIKYFAAADYSEGRELDTLVKAIIDRTAYNEKLETILQQAVVVILEGFLLEVVTKLVGDDEAIVGVLIPCPNLVLLLLFLPASEFVNHCSGQRNRAAGVFRFGCAEYDLGFVLAVVGFVLGKAVDGTPDVKLGGTEINIFPFQCQQFTHA